MSVLKTLQGLLGGLNNTIFLKEEVEKISKARLLICSTCEFNSEFKRSQGEKILRPDNFCTQCGCNLKLKTRATNQQCPLDLPKWLSETNQEIAIEIENKLKEND